MCIGYLVTPESQSTSPFMNPGVMCCTTSIGILILGGSLENIV